MAEKRKNQDRAAVTSPEDKQKAIDATLAQIEKSFGKGFSFT